VSKCIKVKGALYRGVREILTGRKRGGGVRKPLYYIMSMFLSNSMYLEVDLCLEPQDPKLNAHRLPFKIFSIYDIPKLPGGNNENFHEVGNVQIMIFFLKP